MNLRYLESVVLDGGPLDGQRVEAEISRLSFGLSLASPQQGWGATTYVPDFDSWGLPRRSEHGDIHLRVQQPA